MVNVRGEAIVEKTISINYLVATLGLVTGTECENGVRESIKGISVVEWLSTEGLVKDASLDERVTVSDVKVRLDNPDKFLAWVVEIEFDLVRG